MNQRTERRHKNERRTLPTPGDRRKSANQPAGLEWDHVPAIPGTIRPLPGEQVQVERRRFPESGT